MKTSSRPSHAAIVAIPAHDEADRIGDCLAALAMQRDATGAPLAPSTFSVLIFANNCRDATAAVAREFAGRMPFALDVVERRLPAALSHAGGARRVAMDLAADRLARDGQARGVLLTTDADSRVGPTWVAGSLAAIGQGVDAVAGYVDAEPSEYLALGRGFLDRGRLEDRYLARAAEIEARLDPRPHDPWPNHRVHSGASFALTLSAYRAVGGLPPQPLGEDAALGRALEAAGLLVRHSLDVAVVTSCRFDSRARGGAGDTMKLRHAALEAPCDADLRHASRLVQCSRIRGLLRGLHAAEKLAEGADPIRRRLRIDRRDWAALASEFRNRPFAQLWERIEAASPALARSDALTPADLPAATRRLDRVLDRLRTERTRDRADSVPRGAPPWLAEAAAPSR